MDWRYAALLFVALVVPAYFLWTLIHETAHLIMARVLIGVEDWRMKPYPHYNKGRFYFGSVQYIPQAEPTRWERAMISLAPRFMNLGAVVLFPFSNQWSGYWMIVWGVLIGAGLIDLVYGSVGYSTSSDLQRASAALEVNPWLFRILGFGLFVGSAGLGLTLIVLKLGLI